jgi:hypothetical protein
VKASNFVDRFNWCVQELIVFYLHHVPRKLGSVRSVCKVMLPPEFENHVIKCTRMQYLHTLEGKGKAFP